MAKKPETQKNVVAQNRRARFDYFIEDTMEAGLVLTGSEVKSLRAGKASIVESYAAEEDGGIWLINAHIPEYPGAKHFGHAPRRHRKLLLHRREMERLSGQIKREGVTLVPLNIYFNERGIAKLTLGLARGKKQVDKRETIKQRDWQRDKARLMRERG
ncbi:MAG: SsrA-binding protein SmpB [Alphaproteobacteria bacterium]|nr:SsrA-binding protein SmpB [Alphaproteobacteria bacterium]MCB9929575.1 SsrA-binding protein SmpB [Alphaproteobacteria bacterium]